MSNFEADIVSRSLVAIVDIGSNGIRFSISSKAPHHARIMPSVYKDRLGISLFDIQYQNGDQKRPIPKEIITEVCHAMLRFKLICEDFGVSDECVEVIATESTRDALNCDNLIREIELATKWKVNVFNKKQECDIGCFGVISSFNLVSGLFVDIGGGSFILSWIQCKDGVVRVSDSPVSLPYGAGALSRRL
ncbi:Ppx/GppA phosphatase, partial [Hanseniaspora valbyensis NRRL Y-1626]